MKKIIIVFVLFVSFIGIGYLFFQARSTKKVVFDSPKTIPVTTTSVEISTITMIAEHLDTPWAIAFLPPSTKNATESRMFVTERTGNVRFIENGVLAPLPVATLSSVKEIGEGGLLGIALHPKFSVNNFVYLYYTYSSSGSNTFNRVVRMTYVDKKLVDEKIIIDRIPGASNHNGGRITFGPDGYLYVTTGDAENPTQAQNTKLLGGKILRSTDEGKPVSDNPFGNLVYSYGHRNPQGLAWDTQGNLWETEHGRSGITSGFDEVNLIEKGKNYGWPTIQGDVTKTGMVTPKRHSGATTTWAPAGAAMVGNSLFFGGLKGQALYEATIADGQVIAFTEQLKDEFGRIRDVVIGPDQMLYITTSNKDGRGTPEGGDDRIIKINPQKL